MKLQELVNKHYRQLNDNDRHIWNFICEHREDCYLYTIDEFSKHCNVSTATLVRFAKKISLNGFSELKSRLKWEHDVKEQIETEDLHAICESYHKLIDDIQKRDCRKIFQLIEQADRVFIYGTNNTQRAVADEFKRIFLTVNKCFYVINGLDMVESLVQVVQPNDVIIIISLSGDNPAVVKMARHLMLKKIPIISMTKLQNNELALISDESLYINTMTLRTNLGLEYEITTPYFILIELLFLKYQLYLSKA